MKFIKNIYTKFGAISYSVLKLVCHIYGGNKCELLPADYFVKI